MGVAMPSEKMPWVVVAPSGVYWLGHAEDEDGAWRIALGWPDVEEVREHRRVGWYAAAATVSWTRPSSTEGAVSRKDASGEARQP